MSALTDPTFARSRAFPGGASSPLPPKRRIRLAEVGEDGSQLFGECVLERFGAGLLVWTLTLTVAVGFATGLRLHADLANGLAAFGLCMVFGFAFEWVFITMGLVAGNAQAAQGLSMSVFPLTFVSSAYVPVSTMPSWMRAFAEHQPITVMVDAVRCLSQGARAEAVLHHTTGYCVGWSLAWAVGILAVFAPLAIIRFARR